MADRQVPSSLYILPPDTPEDQTNRAAQADRGGRVAHERRDPKDRQLGPLAALAYEIARHKEGVYVLEVINGGGELMKELDRRLRVMDMGDSPGDRARGRGEARRRFHRGCVVRPSPSAGESSAGCRRSDSRARAVRATRTMTIWDIRGLKRDTDEGGHSDAIRTRTIRPAAVGRGGRSEKTGDKAQGASGARCFAAVRSASSARTRSTTSTTRTSSLLGAFVPERGKILPRRIGHLPTHQRKLQTAIKRARQIALVWTSPINRHWTLRLRLQVRLCVWKIDPPFVSSTAICNRTFRNLKRPLWK